MTSASDKNGTLPSLVVVAQPIHRVHDAVAPFAEPVQLQPHYPAAGDLPSRSQALYQSLLSSVSPELRAFVRSPSLSAVLSHPRLLFLAFSIYSMLRAPFLNAFRLILISAADQALKKERAKTLPHGPVSASRATLLRSLESISSGHLNISTISSIATDTSRAIVASLSVEQI